MTAYFQKILRAAARRSNYHPPPGCPPNRIDWVSHTKHPVYGEARRLAFARFEAALREELVWVSRLWGMPSANKELMQIASALDWWEIAKEAYAEVTIFP